MHDTPNPAEFAAPEIEDLVELFPAYQIHRLIACGGMGAVYCAEQKSLSRTVALKILPKELTRDGDFRAGFEAEAKAMARLNHPNLISVIDFGEAGGMLYIVMEYVHGKSLYHSTRGQMIDAREVIRLMTAICGGLAHAHANGIIHRDIKPANILLTEHCEPKIGDFGLARPVGHKTAEGEMIYGTPGYTAPEVMASPDAVDHRADVFSLGVLLHELLTGKLPVDDPRPASLIADCDVRFDAVIRKATAAVPSARYSNASALSDHLREITSAPLAGTVAKAAAVKGQRAPQVVPGRINPAGEVRKKEINLTWIGPLVALVIIFYSIHAFTNRERKVVVVEAPSTEVSEVVEVPGPGPVADDAEEAPPEIPARDPVTEDPVTTGGEPDVADQPTGGLEYGVRLTEGSREWSMGKGGGVAGLPGSSGDCDGISIGGFSVSRRFQDKQRFEGLAEVEALRWWTRGGGRRTD